MAESRRTFGPIAAVVTAGALAGCSATFSMIEPDAAGETNGGAAGTIAETPLDAGGLSVYLETMQQLIEGDLRTKAAVFGDVRDAAQREPTTANRLRLALAMSVPGHNGSNAAAAAERLLELVTENESLSPEERALALIQLETANELLSLDAKRLELEQAAGRAPAASAPDRAASPGSTESLDSLRAENERLARELEDATKMLDALTRIEQSLTE